MPFDGFYDTRAPRYFCKYCGRPFKDECDCRDHTYCKCEQGPQLPIEEVRQRCEDCGEYPKDLYDHKRKWCLGKRDPLAKICKFCGDVFEKPVNRIDHELVCPNKDDEPTFKCPHCRTRFVSHYYYTKHIEICPEQPKPKMQGYYEVPHHEYVPPANPVWTGDIEHRFLGDPRIPHDFF